MTPLQKNKVRALDLRKMGWIVVLFIVCLVVILLRSMKDPNELIISRLFTIDAEDFAATIDVFAAFILGLVAAILVIWFFDIDFKVEAEDSRFVKKVTASFAGPGGVALILICATYWALLDSRQKNDQMSPKLAISGLFSDKHDTAQRAQAALANETKLQAKLEVQQDLLQFALGNTAAKLRVDLDFFCRWYDKKSNKLTGRRVDNIVFTNEKTQDTKASGAMIVAEDRGYAIDMRVNGEDVRIADISFTKNKDNSNPVIVVGVTERFQELCSTKPSLVNLPSGETEPPPLSLN